MNGQTAQQTDARTQLRDARRLINDLMKASRQTLAYFEGISVLDDKKLQRIHRDALRQSDRFINKY
jgi:hypothetical protein